MHKRACGVPKKPGDAPARHASKPWWGSLICRIIVAGLLTFFILWSVDFRTVLATIAQSNVYYIPVILALALFDRYLMAYKWAMLLRIRGMVISNAEAFRIYLASGFIGTLLPVGVGADAVKLTRTTLAGRRLDTVTASIFMERMMGLLAVTVLAIVGLSILILVHETQFLQLYFAMWITLAALLGLLLLSVNVRSLGQLHRLFSSLKHYKIVRVLSDIQTEYLEISQHKSVLGGCPRITVK